MKSLYLNNRFFYLFGSIVLLMVISFPFKLLFPVAQTALVLAIALVLIDYFRLFKKNIQIESTRVLPKVFSLGDDNSVQIKLKNSANLPLELEVIDELPFQFQERDFVMPLKLEKGKEEMLKYNLRPLTRGAYIFESINIFAKTNWGFVSRRFEHPHHMEVPVYPSIVQMKKYELLTLHRLANQQGIKKIRRIGHSYEFEQIKTYVAGDDYRSINWKASSRHAHLMVNQYEDERSQQVYCVIDKSRNMRMPFNDLSLMDYAINTSLVISNIALQKQDKAGLLTFSDKIGTILKADRKFTQLNKILAALYREKERDLEANFELLYHASRKLIKGRSLFLLYTNFESIYALERVLPILRRINTLHLLVVVFFKNTEIEDFTKVDCETTSDIYHQTIAKKFIYEKQQMVYTLKQHGIQAVLTRPEDLSINSINKYLELKSRGLI